MNRKRIRTVLFVGILILSLTYTRITLAALVTPLPVENVPSNFRRVREDKEKHQNTVGFTKIVGFCNYNYRSVGKKWYQRLTRLGYSNHVLVATDSKMQSYLESHQMRFDVALAEPIPKKLDGKRKTKRDRAELELLFAVRWKYLLSQLKQGIHLLLTDVDNIFSKEYGEKMEDYDPSADIWFAYATKYPNKAFVQQGFTVCGGMSWWRASEPAIQFARRIHESCGIMCDDQRLLNNLLLQVNMTWDWTPTALNSLIPEGGDERFVGLPRLGLSGKSGAFGYRARIWDRDIAFRGPLQPEECPKNNWISMPIVDAKSRHQNWMAKLESFDTWDHHCNTPS